MSVKILIVEDDKNLNLMLQLILRKNKKLDWVFRSAGDGVEALEVLATYQADLALIDFEMPRMNGVELIREIKAIPGLSQCRLAVLTSRNDTEARTQVKAAGVDNFWLKPIFPDTLFSNITAILS